MHQQPSSEDFVIPALTTDLSAGPGHCESRASSGTGGGSGDRFKRAVCRVLIALSFKSFRRRNVKTHRRRERSDCSDARFLPSLAQDETEPPYDNADEMNAVCTCILFGKMLDNDSQCI